MFEKGSFVINVNNGICEIRETVTMNMTGEEKEYYVLYPIEEKTSKIYVAVDHAEKRIRPAMNGEEARRLISEIPAIDDRYFKLAENQLHGELAFALGVQKSEVEQIIESTIEKLEL